MQTDFSAIRANMVEGQLRPNKVNNRNVLARFAAIAREDFTAVDAKAAAYIDQPAPMAPGREMFEPKVTARLLQELPMDAESHILVLAGGTGYTAAILAGLVGNVTVVEEDATLRAVAEKKLMHLPNVKVVAANPASYAPTQTCQGIVVDAPFVQLPNLPALAQALAEGGKLVGVRVAQSGVASAVALTKHGKSLVENDLFETKGQPLPVYATPEAFVF